MSLSMPITSANKPPLVAEFQVGIAELKIARQPDRLVALGLGSCIGVSLYDPVFRVGGLLHLMLPDSTQFDDISKPARFADLGIKLLVAEIKRGGGRIGNLEVKMAGGAHMFSGENKKFSLNVGERNIIAARLTIQSLGLRITAEEVGGNRGRTMVLDTATGKVMIRWAGSQIKVM